jgi:hypothetical protein
VKLPNNVSESTRRRNPDLYGSGSGLENPELEPNSVPALDQKPKARSGSKRSVVICVAIISCRHRLLDSDNLTGGTKPLRDSIARSLGLDDADDRITWEYHQIKTTGPEQTMVRISTL